MRESLVKFVGMSAASTKKFVLLPSLPCEKNYTVEPTFEITIKKLTEKDRLKKEIESALLSTMLKQRQYYVVSARYVDACLFANVEPTFVNVSKLF